MNSAQFRPRADLILLTSVGIQSQTPGGAWELSGSRTEADDERLQNNLGMRSLPSYMPKNNCFASIYRFTT